MRDEVKQFAEAMEVVLAEHDSEHEPVGWKQTSLIELFLKLNAKIGHISNLLTQPGTEEKVSVFQRECVNVANFAMMMHDVLGIIMNMEDTQSGCACGPTDCSCSAEQKEEQGGCCGS